MFNLVNSVAVSSLLLAACAANAQLSIVSQFPSGVSLVGGSFDPLNQTVQGYPSFGADIRRYTAAGAPLPPIPRPGGSANDADLEITPAPLTLGSTPVPAGSLLYIDGESGVAEVYAMNPATGALISSLVTAFGADHVVGGAYHHQRGTLFLVQDRVPSNTSLRNRVAEVNTATGAVINSWQITATNPDFTVNFGDLDIAANGNLLIVSSDEPEIGEFSPEGNWVQGHTLPSGVNSLCGIGVDQTGCGVWVFETGGNVFRLAFTPGPLCGPPPCDGDVNCDFALDGFDVETMEKAVGGDLTDYCLADPDFNGDFALDGFDVEAVEIVVGGGPCP